MFNILFDNCIRKGSIFVDVNIIYVNAKIVRNKFLAFEFFLVLYAVSIFSMVAASEFSCIS